jgi:hypothetical protein
MGAVKGGSSSLHWDAEREGGDGLVSYRNGFRTVRCLRTECLQQRDDAVSRYLLESEPVDGVTVNCSMPRMRGFGRHDSENMGNNFERCLLL